MGRGQSSGVRGELCPDAFEKTNGEAGHAGVLLGGFTSQSIQTSGLSWMVVGPLWDVCGVAILMSISGARYGSLHFRHRLWVS